MANYNLKPKMVGLTDEDVAELRRLFRYAPDTGHVFRTCDMVMRDGRKTPFVAGTRAGCMGDNGYRRLTFVFDGRQIILREHRAVFYLMGLTPPPYIDHINGLRADNRWVNLRPATRSENALNKHVKPGGCKDLPIGVNRREHGGKMKYVATAQFMGRKKSTTRLRLEDAIAWREKAIQELVAYGKAA
jgi:hypothetical protein